MCVLEQIVLFSSPRNYSVLTFLTALAFVWGATFVRSAFPQMASLKEPREDAILDTVGITGLQREDAVRWLKVRIYPFGVLIEYLRPY